MRIFKTKALVIKRRNLGETSRVLTMISSDRGRLEVLVRGIRRPRHRYSGILEPFSLVNVRLQSGRIFDTLQEADLDGVFINLDDELKGLGVGSIVLEILDRISLADDIDHRVYNLVYDYLRCYRNFQVEMADSTNALVFLSSFLLSVLAVTGRLPLMDLCVVCGQERKGEVVLTVYGACHKNCLARDGVYRVLTLEQLMLMRRIVAESVDSLISSPVSNQDMKKIFGLVLFLYYSFFERDIRSLKFFEGVYRKFE